MYFESLIGYWKGANANRYKTLSDVWGPKSKAVYIMLTSNLKKKCVEHLLDLMYIFGTVIDGTPLGLRKVSPE